MLFVGRPEERKGLPILLRAFEALVEHVPGPADRDRRRARRRAALPGRPGGDALDRRPRPRLRRAPLGVAARGGRALRAVARRRELRHGPDRGVRRRHARRSPRRSPATATWSATASTASSSRPATPSASPRSCSAPTTSPSASRRWARRRARAPSATPGRGSPIGSAEVYERAIEAPELVDRGRARRPLGRPPPGRRRPAEPAPAAALARPAARASGRPGPPRRPPRRPRRRRRPRRSA